MAWGPLKLIDKLSVLITYYGERELLRECLNSISAQSLPPDEVLVYDDASDAPARDYIPQGTNVSILRADTNHGPSVGRNTLLKASSGTLVHFHDADDLFDTEWSARVHDAFKSSSADAVFTEVRSYDSSGLVSEAVLGLQRVVDGMDLVRFCIRGVMLTQAGTYRREAIMAIGGYRADLWQSEDYDFHIRLAASGIRYALIPEPLVIQRLRAGARHYQWIEVWESYLQSVERLSGELAPEYRADLADAAVRAGSALFRLGARRSAKHAFMLAKRIGPPAFTQHRRAYQLLTRSVGFEGAEWLSKTYRGLLPQGVRAYIGGRG